MFHQIPIISLWLIYPQDHPLLFHYILNKYFSQDISWIIQDHPITFQPWENIIQYMVDIRHGPPGTASDVKPWQFLSGIAKDAARAWFVQRAEDRGIAWRCRTVGETDTADTLR
jgi:hypothetical protein